MNTMEYETALRALMVEGHGPVEGLLAAVYLACMYGCFWEQVEDEAAMDTSTDPPSLKDGKPR